MNEPKKVDLAAAKDADEQKKRRGKAKEEQVYSVEQDRAERANARNEVTSDDVDEEPTGLLGKIAAVNMKTLMLKRVLPGAVCLGLAFTLGMCTAPKETVQQEVQPQTVDSVEGAYSVLEDVETLKDDQINALRKQLAAITDGDSSVTQQELMAVSQLNTDAASVLNPFFEAVIAIDPQASESELATHQRNLAGFMTTSASTSTLYNLLSGSSPARELSQRVTTSGSAIPMWVSAGKDRRTYFVAVPIVTEEATMKAMYVVSLTNSKIDAINYLGLLRDGSNPLESILNTQQKAAVAGVVSLESTPPASTQDSQPTSEPGASESTSAAGASVPNLEGFSATNPYHSCAAGDRTEMTVNEEGHTVVTLCP